VFLKEKFLTIMAVNSDKIIDRTDTRRKKHMVTSNRKMVQSAQQTTQQLAYRKYSENVWLLEAFVLMHLQTGASTGFFCAAQ
jgi:hypothetical protein